MYFGDSTGLWNEKPYGFYSHAFICDGYGTHKETGETLFHFNYGYSGIGTGWYSLSYICAVQGSWRSNNTDNQVAVINLRPSGNVNIAETPKVAIAVKAYPNPTQGMVTIETDNTAKLQLFNTTGQLLVEIIGNQIDLGNYPNGLYFLSINGKTVKVVRQ